MYTTCILLYPDLQISIDRMYTTCILLYPPICIFCNLIGTIKAPTLVIVGTQDAASNPVHNSLVVAERIPGAWLVQIHGGGHGALWQYPDVCCRHFLQLQQTLADEMKLEYIATILKFKEQHLRKTHILREIQNC